MIYKLFLEIDPISLNKVYAGMHWAKRKSIADKFHSIVHKAILAKEDEDDEAYKFIDPVEIYFTPFTPKGKRRFDCSNYAFTTKMIEDGMVRAGLLKDDNPDLVRMHAIRSPIRSIKGGILVEIVECC